MARFELPAGAGFPVADQIGKYLTNQLGPGYKFDHQDDELAQTFAGRRGALGRWLNESLFGDMTVVVSNNSLFGTAIRFFLQDGRTLLVTHGIVPSPTLRKIVFPCLGMAAMLGALMLQNAVGLVMFFGWLPLYLLAPRLCAMPLTGKIGRLLADGNACRATGINPPPAPELDKLTPAQRGRFRAFGMAEMVLGLALFGGAAIFAMTQLSQPYSSALFGDALLPSSIASGVGLALAYAGLGRWQLQRVGKLKSGLLLVAASALIAGAWAVVAPQVCPPPKNLMDTFSVPAEVPGGK